MSVYQLGDISPQIPENKQYWIANSARIIGNVTIKENVSIWYGAVIRGDNEPITIEENTNIQDGCILHTDIGFPLYIGRDCIIGHQVVLHGCEISGGSMVGIGATILNGAKIGHNCIIGSGALVKENQVVPDNSMVVGIPARVVKKLGEETERMIQEGVEHYINNWKKFKKDLKLCKI